MAVICIIGAMACASGGRIFTRSIGIGISTYDLSAWLTMYAICLSRSTMKPFSLPFCAALVAENHCSETSSLAGCDWPITAIASVWVLTLT